MKKIRIVKIVAKVLLFCAISLMVILNFNKFYSSYNSNQNFSATNFSNSITKGNEIKIEFRAYNERLEKISLLFVPNSEKSNNTAVTITILDANNVSLFSKAYVGGALYRGQYIDMSLSSPVKSGEVYTVLISSDVQDETVAYRMVMGTSDRSDIVQWFSADNLETEAMPSLDITWSRLGKKTLLLCILCILVGTAAAFAPKTKLSPKITNWVSVATFVFCPIAMVYCIEMLSSNSIMALSPKIVLCNVGIVLAFQLIAFAVSRSLSIGVLASVVAGLLVGIINHYAILYRGQCVTPTDLYAATTAAEVAGRYNFEISIDIIIALCIAYVIVCVATRYFVRFKRTKTSLVTAGISVVVAIAYFVFCTSHIIVSWTGVPIDLFNQNSSAKNNGFLYNFFANIPYTNLEEPDGYKNFDFDAFAATYPTDETDNLAPDIVLIMNESLADYSKITSVPLESDPLDYIHSLENEKAANTYVGTVVVPVYGGGTCNTEMEAITGYSMANFTPNSTPYAQYIGGDTPSFARYLSSIGYHTTAIHPGEPSAWNRINAYPNLGFDDFYFKDYFAGSEQIREIASDSACYEKILSILEENKNAQPQFIFNVTIQNHGGYADSYFANTQKLADTNGNFSMEETYFSLIEKSDDAFELLIKNLEKRDRPTIVIMFGDHQPALETDFLSYIHYDEAIANSPASRYETPIVIWANYDIDTSFLPSTFSSNYISPIAAKLSDNTLNGWNSFLLDQFEEIPIYSISEIVSADGELLPIDGCAETYKFLQYTALKRQGNTVNDFFEVS